MPGNRAGGRSRRRALGAAALGLCAIAALAGCRFGGDDEKYFPLDSGWNWRYRVVTEIRKQSKERSAMVVTNRGRVSVEGQNLTPRMYQDGHHYYYAAQDDGVILVAERAPGDEVRTVQPDQFAIKYPLESGTTWPVVSQTYLLRRQIFSPTAVVMVPITAPIDVTYKIEAKDDIVRVPAGTFRNCLRIHGTASAVRDLGERIGEKEVTVDVVEWFAPGVGMVKMVRQEDSHPESYSAGIMTVELEALDKGSWFD
jgi:hypothetical protein